MAAFPPEIISEILSRLPVKPLFRFKCVSKPWKSLISSPKFIKQHLKQTLISNPISNLIVSHTSLVSAPITTNNDRKLHFSELHHPIKHLPGRPAVELIEACHGVLLLSDYHKKSIFLYNPTTNTHRLLPPAPSRAPNTAHDLARKDVYGFGYDSVSDDYKVVRLLEWVTTDATFGREASVYSMRNNTWSFVKDTTSPYFVQRTNAVLAKEMLHFMVVKRDGTPVLKCFDLNTDTFSLVDYPKMDDGFDIRKVTMSMRQLKGCFCLVVNHQEQIVDPRLYMGDPLYNRRFLCADVWEMRERGKGESWVKLFKVRKQEIGERCMHIRLVTYAKDNRSVLVEFDGGWFGWYDLVKRRVKRVTMKGLRVEDSPYLAWTSIDTLVSVSKEEPVSKRGTETTKKGTESTKKGTESSEKGTKKNNFLSSGFKLSL